MMKKYLIFLTFFTTLVSSAQNGLIDQANDFYKQEKYQEAAMLYDSVLSQGVASAELYYNLGNSLYKMGEIAPAILNYERALQLSPNDEDMLYNRELVQQHVVDEIEMIDEFFLKQVMKNVRAKMSSDSWARLSIMAFALTMLLLLLFLLSRSSGLKQLGFYAGLLALVVSLSSLSFASKGKKEISAHNSAIVFAPTVTVNSSPNENGTNIFVLHEGVKVEIVDQLDEWVEIKLGDGNKGWLKAAAIVEI